MSLRTRAVSLITTSLLLLSLGPARAQIGLPGIPGVPTLPQAAQDYASKQIVKALGDTFFSEQPVRVSLADAYPTVPHLPGGRFHPASQATAEGFFAHAHDGAVRLPAGDYAVSVMTYCMNVHAHAPHHNTFHLAPIRGKWADIVATLNGRVGERYPPRDVQVLSWSLQAGMKYQELSSRSRAIVDAVIPEYKPRLQQSFIEVLQARWSQLSSRIPNVPSFDQALGRLGDVGKAIQEVENTRNTLISNANDFDRISAEFANIGKPREHDDGITPWSLIEPGVYARLRNKGTFLSTGVLQIRVTQQAAVSPMQVAANGRALDRVIADSGGTDVPIPSSAGAPTGDVQPLGMTPRPGDPPDPGQAGSGNNDDDSDSQSPCDPPDNMYGVDKGKLIGTSVAGMQLGRGTGKGIVCLLLRPFINLADLGWKNRGNAEVDDGTVGYGVAGHPEPGHVVVTVHYTYATSSTLIDPYVKKDVTAVIDYGDVTPFCTELVQTLALHGTPNPWLSAAELENRLCITAMTGQTMHINASMMDGKVVGPYSRAHPVDPNALLYNDASGHM